MVSPPIPTPARPPLWAVVLGTLALTGLAIVAARLAERELDPQSLSLIFVVPIAIAAIRFGLFASLAAALLGTLALNYFFVEPRYTFDVARAQDGAALILFAAMGMLVSAIAAQARADAFAARLRAWEAVLLRDFAERLGGAASEEDIAETATVALGDLMQAPAALVSADERAWGAPLDAAARQAAKWCMSTKAPRTPSADAAVESPWSFWPIIVAGQATFALGARSYAPFSPEQSVAAGQIAAQTSVALERVRIAALAMQARRDAEHEKLKSELLSGVSHDLRTPLATILLSLQSLRRFGAEHAPETQAELFDIAETEARRLAALVDSLLDAARLEAGASPVRIDAVSIDTVIEQALAQAHLGAAEVAQHVDADLPLVRADPALAARALANVLENAARHGGAPIELSARRESDAVVLEVIDEGPGLGADPERLFEKFVRGATGDRRAPGLGLGLPIARTLIKSQGGALSGRNRESGGALFQITLAAAHG
jgi:two-component system sensor histidine kinase KdpD